MTPAEIEQRDRRSVEAEKHAMRCAIDIMVRLNYDPDTVRRFRGDLEQIIALWKMKDQARTPVAPKPAQTLPFRVIEGGRPPA